MANYKTGAQRYNDRMGKIWEGAKAIEKKRVSEGYRPNPSLTDMSTVSRKRFKREEHMKSSGGNRSNALSKALEKKSGSIKTGKV